MEEEVSSFSLQSGTDSFTSRSRDVFASLGALEDKHSAFLKATATSRDKDDTGILKNDPDEDDEYVNQAHNKNLDTESYRSWSHGRSQLSKSGESDYEPRSRSRSPNRDNGSGSSGDESKPDADRNFKMPARPPQRLSRKQIPDFRKHPDKYTLYSLGDVSEQDLSEKSNQRAAFDFLEEQQFAREKWERELAGLPEEEPKFDVANTACSQGKIAFSHPKQKKEQAKIPEKAVGKDSVEMSALKPNPDVASSNSDEETKDLELGSVVSDDVELDSDLSMAMSTNSTNTFKSRKNVKRHIRTKGSDDDSD